MTNQRRSLRLTVQGPGDHGLVVVATIVLLTVLTVAMLWLPGLSLATVAPAADLVLNTMATTIAAGVAALAWVRFREAGQTHELFQASAFLALAAGALIALALAVSGLSAEFGFSLDAPGQAPLYLWDLQRLTAAVLLVIGGWIGQRAEPRIIRHPHLVLFGPTVLLILASGLLLAFADDLPRLRGPEQIALLARPSEVLGPAQNPALILDELGIALLFVIAAGLYRRTYLRLGERPLAYLVLGLIVAATAQVHSVFVPTSYSGVVTSVDIFRIAFYAILFVGVAEGARGDLRTLRRANEEMRDLRDAEVRAAGIQERARLAREVHDGLIQDLWLARLKSGHLRGVDGMPEDGQVLADQLDRALDSALGEARQALASLTDTEATGPSLSGSLPRLVDEMAERIEPELDVDVQADIPALPRKVELELLGIVREAIVNAEKHADASMIRVTARFGDGGLRLEVADNGVGFDARDAAGGYGLRSMRERAELVGATLAIESRVRDGTRIIVEMPYATTGAVADRSGIGAIGAVERSTPVAIPPGGTT